MFSQNSNVKKSLIIVVFLFSVFTSVFCSNEIKLSKNAEITLVTSSPGSELYSVFGHSALRVNDPANNIDLAYNYGTFDFSTPNFYYEFSRGRLLYMLSVGNYRYYETEYRLEGRAVYEQVLNLQQHEKQMIFEFLQENALPENRYYKYDFFYDNCATRIRDIVDDHLIIYWFEDLYDIKNKTFRDLLAPYLENMPWNKLGIDVALGLPTDKIAHPYEYMFLPDEMFIAFASAKLSDGSPLVSEHRVLLEKKWQPDSPHFFTPKFAFWLLFLIGIICFLNKKAEKIFDMIFFTALSLTGIMVLFLWFASEYNATNNNMNLLWAMPTHIYFFIKYHFLKLNRITGLYFKIVMVVTAIMVFFWYFMPQGFNAAFFPLVLLTFIKSIPPALKINYKVLVSSLFQKHKEVT